MGRKRKPAANLIDLSGHIAGQRNYADADIDAMIAEVGSLPPGDVVTTQWDEVTRQKIEVTVARRELLASGVETAAIVLAHESMWQAEPAPSAVARDLGAIDAAARRLAALLKRHTADDLHRESVRFALQRQISHWAETRDGYPGIFPDLTPIKFEVDAVDGIDYAPGAAFRRCAAAVELIATAAAQAEARQRHRICNRQNEPRHKGDVALRQFVGKLCSIYPDVFGKRPGTGADGPFVRFVQSALKPLGIIKSGEAIAALVPGRARRRRMVKSEPRKT
jgi:hypothetical protein